MKVKILKVFRDRYTKQVYRVGTTIEVTEERAAEMNESPAAPLVAEVKARKKKEG